jgi:hypothetical protein
MKGDRFMKKVRYALGAAPALGLLLPGTTTAAAATHAVANAGKTVTLQQHTRALYTCTNGIRASNNTNGLFGAIFYSGGTVCGQSASINHRQAYLTERVRYWQGTHLALTRRLHGVFISNRTFFYSSTGISSATEVCEALVLNGTSTVKYGPTCERTLTG